MTRRDYTNASGYFCPTENTAIYLADREPQPKPQRHRGVLTERDLAQMDASRKARASMAAYFEDPPQKKPAPKPKDDDLRRVRNLYAAICSIAAMMDMSIDDITIKVKGDSGRYKTVGPARTIERVEV